MRRLPVRHVLEDVPDQHLRRRVALGPPGHIHLAEQDHPLPFAVLHQRAVLEAEAAVEDRQEIAAAGFSMSTEATLPRLPHRHTRVTRCRTIDRRGTVVAVTAVRTSAAAAGSSPRPASRADVPRQSRPGADDRAPAGKTCRRPYSVTRNPNRFSSTSEVCSNTITFSPSRTRLISGAGPSTVRAALPTISMSYADRSASASTGTAPRSPCAFNEPACLASWGRRVRSSRLASGTAGLLAEHERQRNPSGSRRC